jgi:putative SbcD/Mre11-related phosphoesterase
MQITDGIEIMDLALFVPELKLLIIADVHIGYEEALNSQGILVPRFQFKEMVERLGKILLRTEPETVVITGDLKHEFGKISDQEWRDTLRFLDFLGRAAKKTILIRGNHDTILGPIARKRNVAVVDYYAFPLGKRKIYVCHGDAIPGNRDFRASDTIIIGHEHPAVSIGDKIRRERYKCFLKGKWKKKTLVVMPSLNLVTEGTDVQNEKLLSPFLQRGMGNFEVYAVGEEVLHFGELRNIY